MSWKHAFSLSVLRPGAPLHFAAHSHHPWPDVTRAAQMQAWEDASTLLDRKWEKVFGDIIPEAQGHVARALNLPDPETIVFAPNTHEFLTRILSCLPTDRPLRVLATDSEFHTFARQMTRLEEEDTAIVTRIAAEPQENFAQRFIAEASRPGYDLIFVSDVFFNSGFWFQQLETLAKAVPTKDAFVVIDGYHSFMAVPVNLKPVASRVFYVSGGYKYAMAGEGVCFMHCPPGYGPRPRLTGWYAEFGARDDRKPGVVNYAATGARFAGATFDPSGLYRFNAVMRWLAENNLTVAGMLQDVHALQRDFAELLGPRGAVRTLNLVTPLMQPARGRFLTFQTNVAQAIQQHLAARDILTDSRGDRLRIGFGIYHDRDDLARLAQALQP